MKKLTDDITFGRDITDSILSAHFNKFNDSLKRYNPKYRKLLSIDPDAPAPDHHYICPLCIEKQFAVIDGKILANAVFTLDHVPPESVGGKSKILTCATCNNTAGIYEAELLFKIRYQAFGDKKEGSSINKLTANDGSKADKKHKGFLKHNEDGSFYLDFPEKAKENNPDLKHMLDGFGTTIEEIHIRVPSPDETKLNRALLKSAYLICFQNWGYEFVYSDTANKIRGVLQGKHSYPITLPLFLVDGDKVNLPIGLGIITSPKEVQGYCVNIPLREGNNYYIAPVLIAPPTKDGWDILKNVHDFISAEKDKEGDISWSFTSLNQCLPTIHNGYTATWNLYKSGTLL